MELTVRHLERADSCGAHWGFADGWQRLMILDLIGARSYLGEKVNDSNG
jgi:hypothetical protein